MHIPTFSCTGKTGGCQKRQLAIVARRILASAILLLVTVRLFADGDNFYFMQKKVEDGLSQNTVFAIFQDSDGFVWIGTNDGLNRFDGSSFRMFRKNARRGSIGCNKITDITEAGGLIFVGTAKGLYEYNPQKESFRLIAIGKEGASRPRVNALFVDRNTKRLLIATETEGVFAYDYRNALATHCAVRMWKNSGMKRVNCLLADRNHNVWIASEKLVQCNAASGIVKVHPIDFADTSRQLDYITDMAEDDRGALWMATAQSGLVHYDYTTGEKRVYFGRESAFYVDHIHVVRFISHDTLLIGSDRGLIVFNPYDGTYRCLNSLQKHGGLSDNSVYSICMDREHGLWIGTFFGGINYVRPNSTDMHLFSMGWSPVSRFCEDGEGNMWIGTEGSGIKIFSPQGDTFTDILGSYNVQPIVDVGNTMLVGTYGHGLLAVGKHSHAIEERFDPFPVKPANFTSLIKAIYRDSSGNLWVGGNLGLAVKRAGSGRFEHIKALCNYFVWDIAEDSNHNLWVVTSGEGVFRLRLDGNVVRNYRHADANLRSLPDNYVLTMCKDMHGRLWFGTENNGFCRYDATTDDFTCFNNLKSFPNWLIYSIVCDDHGDIWLATSNGLYRYSVTNGKISVYTVDDGLQSNQFNFNSGYKAANGCLYFGGVNGFNAFFPEKLKVNASVPPVKFTRFELLNQSADIQEPHSPLETSITYTHRIDLSHDQNSFGIEFVALSFSAPAKNMYRYKLEGLDKNWIESGNVHKAIYNNVPPGHYVLHVVASNNDGVWNQKGATVEIVVHPPLWATWWAFTLYIIFIVVAGYSLIHWYLRRKREKQQYELEKQQVKHEKALTASKISFFTNIAHEIRTPLSLIMAPVEALLTDGGMSKEQKAQLQIVNRNSQQLHTLITQLLDFRKIEEGEHKLNSEPVDVVRLAAEVEESFRLMLKPKGVLIGSQMPCSSLTLLTDGTALRRVMQNLLSNAAKFTHSSINTSLSYDETSNLLTFKVIDDGIGVPDDEKKNIFKPFKQVTAHSHDVNVGGIGIGLAYSATLVRMLGGNIGVYDNPQGRGSVFWFTAKASSVDVVDEGLEPCFPDTVEVTAEADNRQKVMVVEDNDDMRHFLKTILGKEYSLVSATNGAEALEKLRSETVDIVITDVMMPVMDGQQLIRSIREDSVLCHLLILVLTAKTTATNREESYEGGADGYIEKPFSTELLLLRVKNLLEMCNIRREKYVRTPFMKVAQLARNKQDEEFVNKMKDYITNHLGESNFNVNKLAQYMGLSRSAFFVRLKGISGMTPNEYIRMEKLRKAAELIAQEKYSVETVAEMIGYSTPSYFAHCFREQFGVSPKDFKKDLSQGK